jgi:hypothetical protein
MTTELQNIPVITKESFVELQSYLSLRHDAAIEELSKIGKIETEEACAEAVETLSAAKKLYDAMSAKRKAFTDPIKEALSGIMIYENAINYTAKTDNVYNQAWKQVDAYNQKKLSDKKIKEHEAWLVSETMKYKAEFKAKVEQQLVDMMSGLNKTLVDGMAKWEADLTLESLDAKVEGLRSHKPKLKQDHYDKCFHLWGQRPDVMSEKLEREYLEVLKKELPYDKYNEDFQVISAPIKNAYLAKVDQIKENLLVIRKAGEADKKKMEEERQAKLEESRLADLKKVEAEKVAKTQEVEANKDLGQMEASFIQQGMTADLESAPTKLVASFVNDNMWLKPLLTVISKVATNPKFKGIKDSKGQVRKEVQFWLDQYSSLHSDPVEGLDLSEEVKTVIKSK